LHGNCLLQHAEEKIEGMIEVMRRQGRRYKQLLDDVKEMRGHWTLKAGSTRSHSVENLILEEDMDLF